MTVLSVQHSSLSSSVNRSLAKSSDNLNNSVRKLSSGVRINKAGDDVASMSIAAKVNSRLKGIQKAKTNAYEMLGHLEVAKSGLNQSSDNLQRIRELFVQGINGTNSVDEKNALQREINELIEAQDTIARNTKVNVTEAGFSANPSYDRIILGLFGSADGSDANRIGVNYQLGANDGEQFNLDFTGGTGTSYEDGIGVFPRNGINNAGINNGVPANENKLSKLKIPGASIEPELESGDGPPNDTDTLDHLTQMINNVSRMHSVIDAKYSYVEARIAGHEEEIIDLNKSLSNFQDTDIAAESKNYIQSQIKQNTAASMLSQANSQKQFALSLLP